MHLFVYNGKSSMEFGATVSGEDTWKKPSPDLELTSVPGRNGDLITSNKRYSNIVIPYQVGITKDFDRNYTQLLNFLLSDPSYHRLEDSYHPDVYRMAVMDSSIEPSLTRLNREGQFKLSFSCKPQMFLKSGERKQTYTLNGVIYNPTLFNAKPLLRVYGEGQLTVGEDTVTILHCDGYTDIDCETEDAYKDSGEHNCNSYITLSGDDFPVIHPGNCGIKLGTGITKVEVIPRWWML